MITMSDIMANRNFLEGCIYIEKLCKDMYHSYCRIYNDIPDAVALWEKAALDKEEHKRRLELLLRLTSSYEFTVSPHSLDQARSIQYKLHNHFNLVINSKPDLLTAISQTVEMEEELSELRAHTARSINEETMQIVFRTLCAADNGHISSLKRYRNKISNYPAELSDTSA